MATECCEGLDQIDYSGYYDEECDQVMLGGAPAGVCSKCGDGECEEWETKCTCAEDCGDSVTKKTTTTTTQLSCDSGCTLNDKCLPFGIRSGGKYCSLDGQMADQKIGESECENDFECLSNSCIDDSCVKQGLIQQIIRILAGLFGL
jgi:hypothetical protein